MSFRSNCLSRPIAIWAVLTSLVGLPTAAWAGMVTWAFEVGERDDFKFSRALLIGADRYVHPWWPTLENAVKDANAVADELRFNHGYEVDVIENPSGELLSRAIKEFFIVHGSDPEGRLLLWFSGHGHVSKGNRTEGFLVPVDAPSPEGPHEEQARFRFAAVSMSQIKLWMRLAKAKHVLVVLDNCFAGTALEIDGGIPRSTSEAGGRAYQIIAAGRDDEKVGDRGVFREVFLEAISGAAPNMPHLGGVIMARSHLGPHLWSVVTERTKKTAWKQTPQHGYLTGGGFAHGDYFFKPPRLQSATSQSSASSVTGLQKISEQRRRSAKDEYDRLAALEPRASRQQWRGFISLHKTIDGIDPALITDAEDNIKAIEQVDIRIDEAMNRCLAGVARHIQRESIAGRVRNSLVAASARLRFGHSLEEPLTGEGADNVWYKIANIEVRDDAVRFEYASANGLVKVVPVAGQRTLPGTDELVGTWIQSGATNCIRLRVSRDGTADADISPLDGAVGRSFERNAYLRAGSPS